MCQVILFYCLFQFGVRTFLRKTLHRKFFIDIFSFFRVILFNESYKGYNSLNKITLKKEKISKISQTFIFHMIHNFALN